MNPRINTIVNKPVTYFKNRRDCVCYYKAYSFRIAEASYRHKDRKLYLKFELLSEFEDGESMYTVEEYGVDESEFYFLVQNLLKPNFGEIVPIFENDFVGITGQVYIYVIQSKIYLDTLSMRISWNLQKHISSEIIFSEEI